LITIFPLAEFIMKKIVISATLATIVATVIGCSTMMAPVSMRGSEVTTQDHASDTKVYAQKVPGVGEAHLITRTFINQPPVIPHGIEKYVPLTMEENACMECHQSDELRGKPVPQIGKSHFAEVDGKKILSMTRFQCDSCHVPQVDAPPLVENTFVGVTK
jgi:nitrate reductase (cytochrome), electron transfer subunit